MHLHFRRYGRLAIAAVVAAGLAITAGVAHWTAQGEDAEARTAYDDAADTFVARAQARLRATAQLVHYVAAVQRVRGGVARPTLAAYARELDIRLQYPGFVAMGIVARGGTAGGRPGAARWPVSYVDSDEPHGRVAPGYDMGAAPGLRAVLDTARDSGSVAGSSGLDTGLGGPPGFILVHPLYAGGALPTDLAARRRLIAGFVFVMFDARSLLADLVEPLPAGVAVRVLAGASRRGAERVLYDSLPNVPRTAASDAHRQIEPVGGESWLLEAARIGTYADDIDRDRSRLVLALGV
ncbi:MAG: CHASE domain-containing protein, partial [Rhodocyclaceae bacterium]|nr:CHASE domain-containing protein [Rhodocyclaceae bacterium]